MRITTRRTKQSRYPTITARPSLTLLIGVSRSSSRRVLLQKSFWHVWVVGSMNSSSLVVSKEQSGTQHEPVGAMLSQAVSLSSQPSLPSLPSLGARDTNVSPSLHQRVATLKVHRSSSSYVSALAVDGDSLYSASSEGCITVWSLQEASRRQEHHQQDDDDDRCGGATVVVATSNIPVKCLLAKGNGTLLSSHQDGKIRAWRIGSRKDGTQRLELNAVLPTASDRLRTCLLPWSYVEVRRHRRRTWVHHVDAVAALAVSPDGALLYSASWDRSLKVWRSRDFRCLESVPAAHDDAINAMVASPDGHVYTGSADKRIKAWRRRPGRKGKHVLVATLERHRSAVNALALGGFEGKVLYSGACDRSVVVRERGVDGSMKATGTLRGHAKAILCLAAAGDVVCSGSADRTVRVWRRGAGNDSSGYTCLAVLDGHGAAVKSLALVRSVGVEESSSGGGEGGSALVCSGALDGEVKIWSVLVPCLLERGLVHRGDIMQTLLVLFEPTTETPCEKCRSGYRLSPLDSPRLLVPTTSWHRKLQLHTNNGNPFMHVNPFLIM